MKTMIISFVVLLVALLEFNPADFRTLEEQRAEFRRRRAQPYLCCCVSNPGEHGHNRAASGVRVRSGQPNRLAEWLEYLLCCVGRSSHGHRD